LMPYNIAYITRNLSGIFSGLYGWKVDSVIINYHTGDHNESGYVNATVSVNNKKQTNASDYYDR
jgi:hypothetical protein